MQNYISSMVFTKFVNACQISNTVRFYILLCYLANLANKKLKNLPSFLLLLFNGDEIRKTTHLSNVS